MLQPVPGAPPEIAVAIDELVSSLTKAAGANLAGVILYGGLARGRFRADRSDVNIVVLLRDASLAALRAIAPALQSARRSAAVEPMILTLRDVAEAADVFPTKFLDIQRCHIVLAGDDPFAALSVSHEHVRLRTEQELRNMLLRLRRVSIDAISDHQLMLRSLTRTSRPLAVALDALLRLAGKPAPADDRTSAIFDAAAAAFDLSQPTLASLAELRQQTHAPDDPASLFAEVLNIIAHSADIADRMKEPTR